MTRKFVICDGRTKEELKQESTENLLNQLSSMHYAFVGWGATGSSEAGEIPRIYEILEERGVTEERISKVIEEADLSGRETAVVYHLGFYNYQQKVSRSELIKKFGEDAVKNIIPKLIKDDAVREVENDSYVWIGKQVGVGDE